MVRYPGLSRDLVKFLYNVYHPCDPVAYRIEPIFMKIYAQIEPNQIHPWAEPYKVPYSQLPLQPLVRRDPSAPGEAGGVPVNIANGSINVDIGKMGAMAGVPGAGQDQANGWGLLNMMRDAAAAVRPAGGQPGPGLGANGQLGAPGFQAPLQLPDGKRLAYRWAGQDSATIVVDRLSLSGKQINCWNS